MNLPLPKSGKIRYIIHLSDIHIHIHKGDAGKSRYNEYLCVRNNSNDQLNKYDENISENAVIIVLGDIFQDKDTYSSSSINLFYQFIHSLSQFCPLYLIQGNHDYEQELPDNSDIISNLLHGYNNPNIYYLYQTDRYLANDIGFGFVSVRDTLRPGATFGQVEKL